MQVHVKRNIFHYIALTSPYDSGRIHWTVLTILCSLHGANDASLFWAVTRRCLTFMYRTFGTACRPHRQESWTLWSSKMRSTGSPETSVTNFKSTLRNIPKERRCRFANAIRRPVAVCLSVVCVKWEFKKVADFERLSGIMCVIWMIKITVF